jgi:hypothetical protein
MVEPCSRHLLHEVWKEQVTHAERKALREKHRSYIDKRDTAWCVECGLIQPCDVIKVLDYLDIVEPMPEINWAGGK